MSTPNHVELIARGILLQGSRVLLCQEKKHGYRYLPGGHVEVTESAAAALEREFLEECGLRVRTGALALVSEGVFKTKKKTHHEINLVFHVEHPPSPKLKKVKSKEDRIAFEWVELAALPDLDVRPLAAKAFLATLGSSSDGVVWVSEVPVGG